MNVDSFLCYGRTDVHSEGGGTLWSVNSKETLEASPQPSISVTFVHAIDASLAVDDVKGENQIRVIRSARCKAACVGKMRITNLSFMTIFSESGYGGCWSLSTVIGSSSHVTVFQCNISLFATMAVNAGGDVLFCCSESTVVLDELVCLFYHYAA